MLGGVMSAGRDWRGPAIWSCLFDRPVRGVEGTGAPQHANHVEELVGKAGLLRYGAGVLGTVVRHMVAGCDVDDEGGVAGHGCPLPFPFGCPPSRTKVGQSSPLLADAALPRGGAAAHLVSKSESDSFVIAVSLLLFSVGIDVLRSDHDGVGF